MDNSQALRPGHLLHNGSYRIEAILGQGGFGITYLAKDFSLDCYVAIKEFFPRDYCGRDATNLLSVSSPSMDGFIGKLKDKFIKEARKMARLSHPGIVHTFACFEENGTAYYVMNAIQGTSLAEYIKSTGPLDESTALDIIRRAGDALDYIHSMKMTHLDVKPANIMLRAEDKCPILIDFGLSKHYDEEGHQTSTTPTGMSHGFAPLEQYEAGGVEEFSPRSDVYALAATLYNMLTGTVPPRAFELLSYGLTFPAFVSPRMQHAISHAMAPLKANRTPSVKEFLTELEGFNNTQEAFVHSYSTPNEETRFDGNNRSPHSKTTTGDNSAKGSVSSNPSVKRSLKTTLISFIVAAACTGFFFIFRSCGSETASASTASREGAAICAVDTMVDGEMHTPDYPIYGGEVLLNRTIHVGDSLVAYGIQVDPTISKQFDIDFKEYGRVYNPAPEMGKMLFISAQDSTTSDCKVDVNIDLHADKKNARVSYTYRHKKGGYGYLEDSWGKKIDVKFTKEYIALSNAQMNIDLQLYRTEEGWLLEGTLGPNLEVTNLILKPDMEVYNF